MADLDYYELIGPFLRNELQGEVLDSFKEKLKSDSDFAFEVGMQRDIINSYSQEDFDSFKEKVETLREEIDGAKREVPNI